MYWTIVNKFLALIALLSHKKILQFKFDEVDTCQWPGEVCGRFVPQSVSNRDGQLMDVDIVLNELFEDGSELQVEYSNGPIAYQARYLETHCVVMLDIC